VTSTHPFIPTRALVALAMYGFVKIGAPKSRAAFPARAGGRVFRISTGTILAQSRRSPRDRINPPRQARVKASQEAHSACFRPRAWRGQLGNPKRLLGARRSACHPHIRQLFLSAVRRTHFRVSRLRRLPHWVGERVFGEAKKGRAFRRRGSLGVGSDKNDSRRCLLQNP
jgi:hypothetical protein